MEQKTLRYKLHRKQILMGVILVIPLIFLCFFAFMYQSRSEIERMAAHHLQDVNQQAGEMVKEYLERSLEQVKYTAAIYSVSSDVTAINNRLLLEQLMAFGNFDRIWFVDKNGRCHSPEGRKSFQGDGHYIPLLLQGHSGISEVFQSKVTKEDILTIYAPVKKEGTIVGGIVGAVDISNLADLVTSAGFNGRAYSYILDPGGTLIMQTSHKESLYFGRDFAEFFTTKIDKSSKTFSQLTEAMANKRSGTMSYTSGGEDRIAYYAPLGLNDWYVATILPTEAFYDNTVAIYKTAFYLSLELSLIFLAFIILVIWWSKKTQRILIHSKAAADRSNRQFRMAIEHTSIILFEYSEKDRSMIIKNFPKSVSCKLPSKIADIPSQCVTCGLVSEQSQNAFCNLLTSLRSRKENLSADLKGGFAFEPGSWFRISLSPLYDEQERTSGAIGTIEDITSHKNIEEKYMREEQLRKAFFATAVSIWSFNLTTGKFLSCSYQGEDRLSSYVNWEYNAETIESLCIPLHPQDREKIMRLLDAGTLISFYEMGLQEIKEEFLGRKSPDNEYRWYSLELRFYQDSITGDALFFCCTRDIHDEKQRLLALQFESERDSLTGLYNRSTIRQLLSKHVAAALEEGTLLGFCMLDMDHFKEVNDTYGHLAGDTVLTTIANTLSETLANCDYAARLGGDEFVCLICGRKTKKDVLDLAQQLLNRINRLCFDEAPECCVSTSIGIAFAIEHGSTFDDLYSHADQALYEAKITGKNCVKVFEA